MSPFVRDVNPGMSPGSIVKVSDIHRWVSIQLTLDHVTHQVLWIPADVEEFQTMFSDK